jgi:hypothetical protein
MEPERRVSAIPLYMDVERPGGMLERMLDGEYRIIEVDGAGNVIRHGSTTDKDWAALQPSEFAGLWGEITDTLRIMGVQAERSVLMRLGKDHGAVLVGCIKLGELDLGAGDRGSYYLTIVTSYDGSRASEIHMAVHRSVCANMEALARREAMLRGRVAPVNLSMKNRGGIKLAAMKDLAVQCAEPFTAWAREYEERMRKLKAIRLEGEQLFSALYDVGIETGALKRGRDKGGSVDASIPLSDDVLASLKGFSGSKLRETNVGERLLGSMLVAQYEERNIGIEDCVGTAFGAYQGLTRFSTRRGEEGFGPFVQMASALSDKVLGVRQ